MEQADWLRRLGVYTGDKAGTPPMPSYRPVSIKQHVAVDYVYVAAGFLAPWVLGYSHLYGATLYTLGLAVFGLGLNLLTDNPGGLWKVLPFKWHQLLEWAAPPPFIVVPWLFFADAGATPWFLTAVGIGIVLNTALTRLVDTAEPT